MRYRIGEDPANGLGQAVTEDGLTIFTAILSVLIGVGFVVAGIKARQYWLLFWGAGLVLASLGYLASVFI